MVEAGSKPLRPVGYALAAEAEPARDGAVRLTFANPGALGAALIVYDRTDPSRAPRRYTVEAGKTLTDRWISATGRYDLVVHGPSGFLRAFAGTTGAGLITRLEATAGGEIELALFNPAETARTVSITEAYGGRRSAVRLAPGAGRRQGFHIAKSAHWYDLTIRCEGQAHRYAGHVETGAPSLTDPALSGSLQGEPAQGI